MKTLRIALFGQRSFGAATAALINDHDHDLALIVAPAHGDTRDRLAITAEHRGVPFAASETWAPEQMPENIDLIVAAHSHTYLGRRTRNTTKLGALGYHPSLLPRHRGRDAVSWTLHMGDPIAGGTVYWLNDNIDTGDIAASDWCHVHPSDTPSTLWRDKLFPMGLNLIRQTLTSIEHGLINREPQDEQYATWEPARDTAPLRRSELIELGPMPDGFTHTPTRSTPHYTTQR